MSDEWHNIIGVDSKMNPNGKYLIIVSKFVEPLNAVHCAQFVTYLLPQPTAQEFTTIYRLLQCILEIVYFKFC